MYLAQTYQEIDYQLINKILKDGAKLRIDIGTSICSPVTKFWLDNIEEDILVLGFDPNPDCVFANNFWNNSYMNILETFKNHPKTNSYYHIIGALDNVPSPQKGIFYRTTVNVGCSSLLKPIIKNLHGCSLDKELEVDIFPMSYILDNIDYSLIELVKIDAQGKDVDIVKSFGRHLKNVIFLDVESDTSSQYENAPNSRIVNEEIVKLGFEMYHNMIDNFRYKTTHKEIPNNFNNISGNM
jgi:hypothetical protein